MTNSNDLSAGRRQVARSRGALSGVLLIILGAWAALVPFIGPYFDFAFSPNPDDAWHWTSGRGVYELLPGALTVLAGIVLLLSASRALTLLMSWLAALSGAWLVVGPTLDRVLDLGVGTPDATGDGKLIALVLLYFYGTGAVIAILGGIALGRLSVHSVRDVRAAERRAEADVAPEPVVPVETAEPRHEAVGEPAASDTRRYEPRLGHDAASGTAGSAGYTGGQHSADHPADPADPARPDEQRPEGGGDPYGPPR